MLTIHTHISYTFFHDLSLLPVRLSGGVKARACAVVHLYCLFYLRIIYTRPYDTLLSPDNSTLRINHPRWAFTHWLYWSPVLIWHSGHNNHRCENAFKSYVPFRNAMSWTQTAAPYPVGTHITCRCYYYVKDSMQRILASVSPLFDPAVLSTQVLNTTYHHYLHQLVYVIPVIEKECQKEYIWNIISPKIQTPSLGNPQIQKRFKIPWITWCYQIHKIISVYHALGSAIVFWIPLTNHFRGKL